MRNVRHIHQQRGFTLVELMLALAFVGTLMLIAATILLQIVGIYSKGVAMKQINQVGRQLVGDVSQLSRGGFETQLGDNGKVGYLCIREGEAWRAYVWRPDKSGQGGQVADATAKTFALNGDPISLVRSNDGVNGEKYCHFPLGSSDEAMTPSEVTSLLTPQVRVLSVDIDSDGALLKKVTFWIGTFSEGNAVPGMTPDYDTSTHTWACQGGSLGDFCAVARFETVIYTPNAEGQ
jgi:prepilin-type N-terminal cleavage/methylation domain-containing protein